MALPVIADVFRCTFNWTTVGGLGPRNVIHVRSLTGTESEVGDAVVAALQDHQFEGMAQQFELETMTVLALDGSSAGVDVAGGGYNSGSGFGAYSPASAIVMSLKSSQRGARGRGRCYIGPVLESVMTDGEIPGANATEIADAWAAFQVALLASTPACELVIASYTHSDQHQVTNFRCDTILGTQRRRQDQLR